MIDIGENDGEIMYLIKWCAQTYDQCTWESQKLIESLDSDVIAEYEGRNVVNPDKKTSYTLPGRNGSTAKWIQLMESPVYKNDNTLRSYQLEGLNWLTFCWHNKQNSILADEMGLGKTIQSTAFLNELYMKENIKGPFLVVTPLSTIGNWEREIRGWTEMNVVVFHGNNTARNIIIDTEFYYRNKQGEIIPDLLKVDIVLTTYEIALGSAYQLKGIPWRCVVLDEAHRLKNKTSKVSEVLKSYKMEHRVLLTGTPLQNSLDELWALLNFLEPSKFASEAHFKENYGSLSSAADVEKLQGVLKPLMLRRLKEDVETSIPVKEETIVEVELTTTQKKWYRSILEKNFSWLKQGSSKKTNVPNLINVMIELRKCCIHPYLLKGAEDQIFSELNVQTADDSLNALIQSSGKMVLIDKLLKKLKDGGHKVLIFSQMTKCLDLIQDYLRIRRWQFERIDGGVRGDQRQASIDRFSAPNSDSFVFLLCTRAGGVGINLTAADTCIIFDSDWNPQNDLQAQSRCHRIGQKKSVQIYRLVTRNTYEREMFDRASMKLGLDKALLQRMDLQSSGNAAFEGLDPSSSKQAALSKHEIEELLKKGAYGAFMDDEASKEFCEEDIDKILERRTQVIRHDNTEEKSSIFSKASFQAAGSAADVDVNDPDFWDKVAKQAELTIAEERLPEDLLIMDMPRSRKQVNRFGVDGSDENDSDNEGDNSKSGFYPSPAGIAFARAAVFEPRFWTFTERSRLERMIMQHGFNNWAKMAEAFPRRSIYDLQICCNYLLRYCLKKFGASIDPEAYRDVKQALSLFPMRLEKPEGDPVPEDYERRDCFFDQYGDSLDIELPDLDETSLPYPWADIKQKAEFNSFFKDANPEYFDHLDKKAKNLILRVSLMFNIRNKCKPQMGMHIPKVLGAPPASWWGPSEDRDMLIGICKHGYQQNTKIWTDPELTFHKYLAGTSLQADAKDADADDGDGENADGGDGGQNTKVLSVLDQALPSTMVAAKDPVTQTDAGDINLADLDVDLDFGASEPVVKIDNPLPQETANSAVSTPLPADADAAADDAGLEADVPLEDNADEAVFDAVPASNTQTSAPAGASAVYIPTASEIGVRVRRILNAHSKYRQWLAREKLKHSEKLLAKQHLLDAKQHVQNMGRSRPSISFDKLKKLDPYLSKRNKNDIQRSLICYGLPRMQSDPAKIDWELFKDHCGLSKKTDESIETYYAHLMLLVHEVVEAHKSGVAAPADEEDTEMKDDVDATVEDEIFDDEEADLSIGNMLNPSDGSGLRSEQEGADAVGVSSTPVGVPDATVSAAAALVTKSTDEALQDTMDSVVSAPVVAADEGATVEAPKIPVGADGETITIDKAKRILKRVDLFDKLRLQVLTDPTLDKKLEAVRRHGKGSMPKWWEFHYDKYFLMGIARYGLLKPDAIIQDRDYPFYRVYQEFHNSLEYRKDNNVPTNELVFGKFDDKFWPREAFVTKRFEMLIGAGLRPLTKKALSELKSQGLSIPETPQPAPSKVLKLKFKMSSTDESPVSATIVTSESVSVTKPKRRAPKRKKAGSDESEDDFVEGGEKKTRRNPVLHADVSRPKRPSRTSGFSEDMVSDVTDEKVEFNAVANQDVLPSNPRVSSPKMLKQEADAYTGNAHHNYGDTAIQYYNTGASPVVTYAPNGFGHYAPPPPPHFSHAHPMHQPHHYGAVYPAHVPVHPSPQQMYPPSSNFGGFHLSQPESPAVTQHEATSHMHVAAPHSHAGYELANDFNGEPKRDAEQQEF